MLANLLPGLRDLRVPLSIGLLWLTAIWLLVYPVVPSESTATGLIAHVYEVFGFFGATVAAGAVSFVAYLIGILQAQLQDMLLPVARGGRGRVGTLSPASRVEAQRLVDRTVQRLLSARLPLPRDPDDRRMDVFESYVAKEGSDLDERFSDLQIGEATTYLFRRLLEEVPLVATRLLANNRDLFDRYDRADAESRFRLGIAVPLLIVSGLIAYRLNLPTWGWLIALVAAAIVIALIVRDGFQKRMESNDAIFQAVFVGEVQFPIIETIDAQIASAAGPESPPMT